MKKALKILCAVLLVTGITYGGGVLYFQKHFTFNTTIEGTDVSLKTVEDANKVLTLNSGSITISERDINNETIEETIDLFEKAKAVQTFDTSEIFSRQNAFGWVASLFQEKNYNNPKVTYEYDEAALDQAINSLYCLQDGNTIEPQNAYITKDNNVLSIIPSQDGCKIDKEAVVNLIKEKAKALLNGDYVESIIDLMPLYEKAEIQTDNAELNETLQSLKTSMDKTITITIDGSHSEKLSGAALADILDVTDNAFTVNEDKLAAYVKTIASKYDVSSYEYINQSSLRGTLKDALLKSESSTVKANWTIIDTTERLIEVSISQQTLWYYENGKLIFSSPVVTGNTATGDGTPTGTYYVRKMSRNNTLRGADYTEHTDYWIGFDSTGNIYGIHDASWRSEFGGSIYLEDGSHGCVNMPVSAMGTLYYYVTIGTKLVIYN